MSDPGDRTRLLWVLIFGIWAMAFVYAFVAFALSDPSGEGFTRGFNRIQVFLGWQGVALLAAIAVFGLGREWPTGSPARRLSAVPLAAAAVLAAAAGGLVFWAGYLT